MEHTPRPWKGAGQGNAKGELSFFGPDGEIGCIRSAGRLADFRLILAAPELLEACELALHAFEDNWAINWGDLINAIAKARGETRTDAQEA